jgi:predicted nucleotidyltransferase
MSMEAPASTAARLERALRPASPGLVSAYLFGSHARGKTHRESDVDVGVLLARSVFPTPRDRFHEGIRLSGLLAGAVATPFVDLVVVNDAPPLLGRRIILEGRRAFCADEEADLTFRRDVQLRAADLEPFLSRHRRLKLDAIAR